MKSIPGINTVALGALKSSHNPTSKLFNWNTVMKEVEKFGVKMNSDQKSLMVAGDPESSVAADGKMSMVSNKSKKSKDGETPLDIIALNPDMSLNETETTLEYIIISLCQALNIQPKQAAGLLTNHNHYLLHACIKGVKSNYEPVVNWYQSIYATSRHLTLLSVESLNIRSSSDPPQSQAAQPLYMLLNALKCGFYSEYITVAEWTCKLFAKIAQDFDSSGQLNEFYSWFVQVPNPTNGQLGGGFEATLYALNKHSQIVEIVALLLTSTFKGQFDKIIPELKQNHAKQNLVLLPQILTELLPFLYEQNKDDTIQSLLFESGIIQDSIRQADPVGQSDNLLRATNISLLSEIWSLESSLIQDNPNFVNEGSSVLEASLKAFKRACRDPNRSLRISTIGLLFRLLDQFAQVRNPQAPVIYKILTFSMIENIDDDVTREFMMTSFTEIYSNHHSIPVNFLIEPLLRVMQMPDKQYSYNIFDFDFFATLAKHQKLTVAPFGIQMMDQLAKIMLNFPLWAQSVSVPFILLADRFGQNPSIQDFLIKFSSITLAQILSLKKALEQVQVKGSKNAIPGLNKDTPQKDEDDLTKKIRRYNVVTIVKKILNLRISEELNEQIKDLVFQNNRRHKQLYGTMCRGYLNLLEFWFPKAKQAMDQQMKQMEDAEKKVIDDEEQRQVKQTRLQEIPRIRSKQYNTDNQKSNRDIKGYLSERDQDMQSEALENQNSPRRKGSQGGNEQMQVVPYILNEPKIQMNKKAFLDIENIKQKREERVLKQKMEEDRKKRKEDRKLREAHEEINKRKIRIGVAKNVDQNQLVLHNNASVESFTPQAQQQNKKEIDLAENIKLNDLDIEEEERDRDGVKILLNKYQKIFKFLFNKYAMSRAQHKKIETFEYFGDKSINLAEINKLLRDHDITQQMINKDQLQTIIRLINYKFMKRLDLSALDFSLFIFLIAQLAFFIYSKMNSLLSPQDCVLQLIKNFEKATRSRGQSTLLYEDPDITTIGDQEVLKEMNRRVNENPDFIIPEGFYKVTEKEQIFNYHIPQQFDIPEEKKIAIEVLDQIVFEAVGVHFLEALVTYEQQIKVKPRIKQSGLIPPPNAGLQYMKPIEKKQFNQGGSDIFKSKKTIQEQPVHYKRPALGVDLKLALYQISKNYAPSEISTVQETAEVLEEILQAVEEGLVFLPEREKIKYTKDFLNKAKEDKQMKELQDRQAEKEKEEKRLKRKHQLQEELEKQKAEKQLQIEETQKRRQESEREQKERESKEKEERKRKLEQRKVKVEEQKNMKLEELERKRKEEEERKNQEKHDKQAQQKQFLQKQKEKLEQEFQLRRKEKDDAEKAKQEFEELKKQKQLKVKTKMESYIKSNKDMFKVEEKEREEIKKFFNDPEVQIIFAKYDKTLEQMFKFYASQDKKQISFQLGNNLQRVNFNEFVKFGFQTNITPSVIPNDDMVLIFRALIRERQDSLTQKELDELGSGVNSLGYEDFKKGLIRIAILGQDQLGGYGGQRLEAKLIQQLNSIDASKPPKGAKSRGRSSIHSQSTAKRSSLAKQRSEVQLQDSSQAITQRQGSLSRKTKEQKLIMDLNKEKERQEKMLSVKIEDKRMSKPFDVSIISPKDLEGLLKYIQLQPDDDNFKIDKKLNKQRIEIQGQKPNKVKKEKALELTTYKNYDSGQQTQRQSQKNGIEGVEMDELESQDDVEQEEMIGPNGQKENWKIKNT